MRWYLIRHAQTTWNRDERIQGHSDPPLSALGQRQAACLQRHFATHSLQSVVSSALARTRATAEAIVAGHPNALNPHIEPELGEIGLGAWEGLKPDEVNAQFDGAYHRWQRTPSEMQIPEGETLPAFLQRVRRARDRTVEVLGAGGRSLGAAAAPEGTAEHVIVSHGGVIAALLADWLDAEYDHILQRLRLDNAGITAVDFPSQGMPRVAWVNSVTHLASLGSATS